MLGTEPMALSGTLRWRLLARPLAQCCAFRQQHVGAAAAPHVRLPQQQQQQQFQRCGSVGDAAFF